jgi:hypothetical protein
MDTGFPVEFMQEIASMLAGSAHIREVDVDGSIIVPRTSPMNSFRTLDRAFRYSLHKTVAILGTLFTVAEKVIRAHDGLASHHPSASDWK